MMKKVIYLFTIIILTQIVFSATTLEIGTKYNPSENNVTYRLNITWDGITTVEVNETCLKINSSVWCNSSTTPKEVNISEIVVIVDSAAPVITNLRNTSTSNDSTFLEFDCDESCNYTISIGSQTIYNNTFGTSHNPYFGGLLNKTYYGINLTVSDSSDNAATNNTFNFTTAANLPPPIYSVPSNLSLSVYRSGETWVMVNCSARTNGSTLTYDLWIKDTVVDYQWYSSSGLTDCDEIFNPLWGYVTYRIFMNATDQYGNINSTNITYYVKPYKTRVGVHVGT